jgi:hypothetical protein
MSFSIGNEAFRGLAAEAEDHYYQITRILEDAGLVSGFYPDGEPRDYNGPGGVAPATALLLNLSQLLGVSTDQAALDVGLLIRVAAWAGYSQALRDKARQIVEANSN